MPPPRGLVQRLDHELHQSGLLPRNARLLIAVSGGADSVALLRLLAAINGSDHWNWQLTVAHIDHGIRGPASAADAAFVRDLSENLKLPFLLQRLKLPATCSEDQARQARLGAFQKMTQAAARKRAPFHAIVTAHHADDQAETMLMRIMRGTGIEGLAGIAPAATVQGLCLLRPLLDLRRLELHSWLHEIQQPWREDETNASERYLRNRVRHTLMPMLNIFWPRGVAALGRLAQIAAESQQLLDAEVNRFLKKSPMRLGKTSVSLSRPALRAATPAVASELLRRAIDAAGGSSQSADFERIREALRLARSNLGGKRIEAGKGITLHFTRDRIQITRPPRPGRGKR